MKVFFSDKEILFFTHSTFCKRKTGFLILNKIPGK